jgi:hypothetical protein
MPHFTFVTTVRDSVYLKQVKAPSVNAALREAIAALPFDNGGGPFDEELEWLQQVATGGTTVTLHLVHGCENTWLWIEGARHEPQYLTHAVQTEMPAGA